MRAKASISPAELSAGGCPCTLYMYIYFFWLIHYSIQYLLYVLCTTVNFFHKEKPTTFLFDVKDGKITVFQGRI